MINLGTRMSRVFLNKCGDYNIDNLQRLFEYYFKEINFGDKIKVGMTVVIKPNLVMKSSPESGVITHPNVVAAVGRVVKSYGAKVLIAESSGGVFTPGSVKSIMSGCGYLKMAEENGFSIYYGCESLVAENRDGVRCKSFNIVKPFVEADYIINIGKLKSHCMTRFTGAVKNLFGTVPGLMKPELHFRFPIEEDFCTMLVDLASLVRPNLSIVDAVDGMEGDGPSSGTKRHIGLVICSEDPFSLDHVASTIADMDPMSVFYLKEAVKRGLYDPELIEIVGEKLNTVIQKGFKQPKTKSVDFTTKVPSFLRPLARSLAETKPIIPKSKCIGCGKCVESCPRKTIKIENKVAVIDYSGCIKCFCCHELCPKHIVKIKRFSLFNL